MARSRITENQVVDVDFLSEPEHVVLDHSTVASGIPRTILELNDTPAMYDSSKYLQSTAVGTFWAAVAGIPGPKGEDGGEWLSGHGVPTTTTGSANNFYLDTDTGDIYRKVPLTISGAQYSVMIERESDHSYTFADAVKLVKTSRELIIDNEDDESYSTGTWYAFNSSNAWDGTCKYATSSIGAKTYFDITIPENGEYDVYSWWPIYGSAAQNAPFTITHVSGTNVVRKDQHTGIPQWNYLATHEFDGAAVWEWQMNIHGVDGSTTFSGLLDTPNNYDPEKYVKSTTSGVEWYDIGIDYYTKSKVDTISGSLQFEIDEKPDTFIELDDTPAFYDSSKYLQSTAVGTFWAAIAGIPGPKGEDGGEWISGYGAPTTFTGTLNNFYLDFDNGDVYKKETTVTGTTQYGVMLAREPDGSYTFADAVRFVKSGREVIIDNVDDEAGFNGNWFTYNTVNAWGGSCRYATYDYTAQVNFEFVVPENGEYDVYAYWPVLGAAATNVPFTITHVSGTTTVRKSQRIGTPQWNYLSTHEFDGAAVWVWKMNIQGIDGSTTFSGLSDTPNTYDNGKYLKSTAVGTEWTTISGSHWQKNGTVLKPKTVDDTIEIPISTGGKIELGSLDAYSRSQIWNYLTDSIFRLGSAQADGDAINATSEGCAVYGENLEGDPMGTSDFSYMRIKPDRVGLYNSKLAGYAGYLFRIDLSSNDCYLRDNTGVKTLQFDRLTGELVINGNLKLQDDQKIIFGSSADSKLWWDSSANDLRLDTTISGVDPIQNYHLTTKDYVDDQLTTISNSLQSNMNAHTSDSTIHFDEFIELSDTPNSYDNEKHLVSTTSGVEWATMSSGITTLIGLSDTPSVYDNSKYLQSTANGSMWAAVAGIPGPTGEDGGEWLSGAGTPTSATGTLNNFYLDTDTGDIYRKETTSTGTSQYGVMLAREADGYYTFADAVRFVKTGQEVIVDNLDDEYSDSGLWYTYNTSNAWANSCRYVTADYTAQADFKFIVPENGSYDVYAYWPVLGGAAANAPYTITHVSGTTTIRKDQRLNGSQWNYLSTHTFDGAAGWAWKMNIRGTDGVDGLTTFSGLTDTPHDYDSGKYLRATSSGVEFADIDHTNIQNIGTNTHVQIDTHVSSTANPHSVTLEQARIAGNIISSNNAINFRDSNSSIYSSTASELTLSATNEVVVERDLHVDRDLYVDHKFTINGGVVVEIIRDEDDMGHDDSHALVTQQSVKAYVDAKPDTLLELTDTPSAYDDEKHLVSTTSGVDWTASVTVVGGDVYFVDTTRSNKKLGVATLDIGCGRNSNGATNQYLCTYNGCPMNITGIPLIFNATLVGISMSENVNTQSWYARIRKNGSATNVYSHQLVNAYEVHSFTLNVDFNDGDRIQIYLEGNSIDYPQVRTYWRRRF